MLYCASCFMLVLMSTQCVGSQLEAEEFLKAYCVDCHTGPDSRGQLDLAALLSVSAEQEFEAWENVADRVRNREMPPSDHAQPSEQQRLEFLDWYEQTLVRLVKSQPAPMRPRRLSAVEYRNTIRSLMGFELEVAVIEAEQTVSEKSLVLKLLPPDPPGRSGFFNDTHDAPLTTVLWDHYSYFADTAISEMFSPGRRHLLQQIVGPIGVHGLTHDQAEQLLRDFARRAFRRPPGRILVESFCSLPAGLDIERDTRFALKRILMSPQFLYRSLLAETASDGSDRVDSWEFAERLSYFLWADMPDEELFSAAETGRLTNPVELRKQIDRMVESPKAITLATDFAHQWLTLGEVEKDNVQVPEAEALRSQPRDFVRYLVVEDRPLIELIDSRVAFVNPFTRRFYGRDSQQMTRYRKADGIEREIVANQKIILRETTERGGILTMPGILAMNQGPILRGVWVLERILGQELPEPPPNVGQVRPAKPGESLSFRERFEQHRSDTTCAVCHDRIDPLGFAFGRYEGAAFSEKLTVDTSGKLPTGEVFQDFTELKSLLVTSQRERVIRNIVRRMVAYAVCRKLELYDRPSIDEITKRLSASDGTYRDLIFAIATSVPFNGARRTAEPAAKENE